MGRARQLAFSFRYDRRGQTTSWDCGASPGPELAGGEALGASLDTHDARMEWYRVVVEIGPDEDPADAQDRAEDLAEGEFRRLHPGAHLVD
jgi:hypothetical protein